MLKKSAVCRVCIFKNILRISADQKQQTGWMGKKKDKNDAKTAKDRQKVAKSISGKKYDLSLTQPVCFVAVPKSAFTRSYDFSVFLMIWSLHFTFSLSSGVVFCFRRLTCSPGTGCPITSVFEQNVWFLHMCPSTLCHQSTFFTFYLHINCTFFICYCIDRCYSIIWYRAKELCVFVQFIGSAAHSICW